MQQPTFQDKEEARKIIQGQGTLFTFDENGYLQMPNGKKPSHEYSQQHRGVQAAVVDLLLACDPQGDRFSLDAKEALFDQMKAIAESFADMSDEHPANTLAYITEDMRIFADDTEEYHTKGWIDRWADVLRCEKKHAQDEEAKDAFPIEQYREEFSTAFAFLDEHKAQIEQRVGEQEKGIAFREKYDGLPPELRASDGFWDSVRITMHAEPKLLEQVRQEVRIGKLK